MLFLFIFENNSNKKAGVNQYPGTGIYFYYFLGPAQSVALGIYTNKCVLVIISLPSMISSSFCSGILILQPDQDWRKFVRDPQFSSQI